MRPLTMLVNILMPLTLTLWLSYPAQADQVTIVADEWCPYNCVPGSSNPGLLIEIAQYALGKAGHSVKYSVLPWSRAIEDTRAGKYMAIVGAYRSDAPGFVFPQKPLATAGDDVFVRPGASWRYSGIKSLEYVSLGVIADYTFNNAEVDAYIRANKSNPERVQVSVGDDALEKNIRKLVGGRIDALIDDALVVTHFLKLHPKFGNLVHAGSLGRDGVYIAFSPAIKQSQSYAALISKGVDELIQTGKMAELLEHYGLKGELITSH
ncbi:MAG: transporter substrate-binding domain-containing protein [Oligoflexia bacterium]|nr:transporter substrate-binding domain-containing protein [Oligoflexia bacterium]